MIPDIKELNFLKKDGKQYATLTQATVTLADMGEKTITSQIKIDGEITPDFSTDWAVEFQGEKYIMPLRQPQGTKEHTSLNSTIDLTFQHWAIYQLKRWMFFTVHPVETGTAVADKYIADVILNLGDFCDLFGQVLRHYYGDTISIDLNPNWEYKAEPTYVSISHSYIWDVLIKFYELFAVRWQIEPMPSNNSEIKGGERYVIKVGYPTTEVDHIFKYGFEGGLLKVERQVQSADIRNMVLGRGGEKNLPLRYFKDVDPNNPDFRGDPDWIEELANIYFTNLHGATFRSYIQGWKAAHIAKYPGYTAIGESNAYASWAYHKGYTDTKFDPVEYVKDDASIAKYGPLLGGLDNNEEIYPTIQGSGMDIVVDVEQILSDDVAGSVTSDAVESSFADKDKPTITTESIDGYQRKIVEAKSGLFYVEAGKYANLNEGPKTFKVSQKGKKYGPFAINERLEFGIVQTYTIEVSGFVVEAEDVSLVVVDAMTGEERSASGIPAGTYYFLIRLTLHNTSKDSIVVTVACESPKLTSATLDDNSWKNTFDIWVKNIWETSKLTSETDDQYAERVWKPILGDREKNNAKVLFTTGALAASEDYEFTIVGFPALDTSKSLNGELSHWRIKLAKSDADLESTGLYVPSTQRQGKAGDKFAFIGTEMTHDYTKWAEEALDNYKKDYLNEVKDIKPTWVVTTDRVKLNNEGNPNALIHVLKVGNTLRLADKRFIVNDESSESAYETLYLQSLTYTYRAASNGDSALNPDVEIVLSNEYATSANPVSAMQADISTLQQQIGSISNIEQIVRAIGDKLYLRKDGISDRSLSPTRFFSLLTSEDFRAGLIGGAGWGFFKDENGNWVLEADRVNVRQEMQVNTLVINQAEGRGCMEIDTAAFMEVTRVDDTTDGYVCYFDQKDGSVANLFHVDDVAFCNRWTPENTELKFYKRRVTAVSIDNITLSKTDVNGSGIPAEKDNIIHFGNYTDKTRQYVKVRDVVGGGYERYLDGLDSVNAQGNEYYFVGKQNGLYDEKPRWFIGDKDGEYAEWVDGKLNIKGAISVQSTIGGDKIDEYIKKVSPPVEQEDIEDFVNNIVDPKIEGIQNQIDGVIETWFYNGVPTLTNYPANGWNTDALKVQHLGDLYYDNDTGTAYRFSQNSQGGYYWNTITDDAITKALAAAKEAQDTADSKRRIFTSQPAPPYDEGDLWVNATYPTDTTADTRNPESGKYYNDILRCGTSKASGAAFAISDWGLSSNYTDDTAANEALEKIAGYAYLKEALLDRSTTIGGVFLSSLIRLGQHNESLQTQTVWSGINGIYTKARDISYWAGGDALDLFNDDDTHKTLAQGARPAAAIIRMDGSAYFAKGNIGFRADGSGWLGNDKTGIKFSNTGVMTFGSGISFNVSNVSGLNKTLTSLANFNTSLTALLCPCDANDNEISWEEATKSDNAGGIKAKSLKSKIGFWSDKFVSALGKNDNEGGGIIGATALSQLTDVSLSGLRNGDMLQFNGQKWTNVAMSSLRPDLTAYVNKAGDTLTGTLTAKRNQFLAYGAAGIDMNNSDITRLNGLWFADAYNSEGEAINFYVDGSLWSRLGASGGTLYFNPSVGTSAHAFGHKVWHEGNDGDGSGLDADKLDGLHSTAFARCDKFRQVDLNTVNDFGFMENNYDADATPERHYPIQEAGLLIYGTAAYSSANQIYGSFGTNRWFARGGGWSTTNKTSWREFAFLDSNVASASKLATARTLWGQSFDGSGNVSGNMTGVGKITTTTLAIATTYDNTWSDGTNSHPWYGYDHRYHNTGVYSTTISDYYGLTLRTSQGNISMNATGNVGIGTTSPTQTLHVAGNVLVSGEAYYRTEGSAGSSWNNGYGALSVGIMNNNSQTPLLVAYRYGDLNWTIPHANRLFAMELLNSGSVLRFGFGGAAKFYFEKDGTFHSENGMWSEGYVSALGQNTSSDERLKRIIRPIKLTVDEIAKAPIYVFEWINGAGIEIGSIAQYWQSVLPEGVRTSTDSYLSMSGNFGLVAAICNARHIRDHEYLISDHGRRIELLERDKHKLEEDNRTLKEENLEIKRQLEQLTSVYNG